MIHHSLKYTDCDLVLSHMYNLSDLLFMQKLGDKLSGVVIEIVRAVPI